MICLLLPDCTFSIQSPPALLLATPGALKEELAVLFPQKLIHRLRLLIKRQLLGLLLELLENALLSRKRHLLVPLRVHLEADHFQIRRPRRQRHERVPRRDDVHCTPLQIRAHLLVVHRPRLLLVDVRARHLESPLPGGHHRDLRRPGVVVEVGHPALEIKRASAISGLNALKTDSGLVPPAAKND